MTKATTAADRKVQELGIFHDGLQDGIKIERGSQRLGHIMKDAQFLNLSVSGSGGLGHEQRSSTVREVLKLYATPESRGNQP